MAPALAPLPGKVPPGLDTDPPRFFHAALRRNEAVYSDFSFETCSSRPLTATYPCPHHFGGERDRPDGAIRHGHD